MEVVKRNHQKKTTSSSSSSKASKTSSSSSVKKSTPPPAKPKNVDKVEFNKPKPQKVTYDPPRPLTYENYVKQEHKEKIESEAHKQIAAEKKVKENKKIINAAPIIVLKAAALVSIPIPPASAGKPTLAEEKAYDDYLRGRR